MVALCAVSTNNFVTCRQTVQENVVRPSVKIVSCETGSKAHATFAITYPLIIISALEALGFIPFAVLLFNPVF